MCRITCPPTLMTTSGFMRGKLENRSSADLLRDHAPLRLVPTAAMAAGFSEQAVKNFTVKRTFVHFEDEDSDAEGFGLGGRRRCSSLPPQKPAAVAPCVAGASADANAWAGGKSYTPAAGACASRRCPGRCSPRTAVDDFSETGEESCASGPAADEGTLGDGSVHAEPRGDAAPVVARPSPASPWKFDHVRGGIASAVAEAADLATMRGGSVSGDQAPRGTGILDGRRLDSKDTRLCCTVQVAGSEYVVTLSAKAETNRRCGSSFSASKGIGFVSVKSISPADARLKIVLTIGSDRSACSSIFRAHHNFAAKPVWCLKPENGIDFKGTLDYEHSAGIPVLHITLSIVNEDAAIATQPPPSPPVSDASIQQAVWPQPTPTMMWPTYMGYAPLRWAQIVDVQDCWYPESWGGEYVSEDIGLQQYTLETMVLGEGGTP